MSCVRVALAIITMAIHSRAITGDNPGVDAPAVVCLRVVDTVRSVVPIDNHLCHTALSRPGLQRDTPSKKER
jgi:hypothetical protein